MYVIQLNTTPISLTSLADRVSSVLASLSPPRIWWWHQYVVLLRIILMVLLSVNVTGMCPQLIPVTMSIHSLCLPPPARRRFACPHKQQFMQVIVSVGKLNVTYAAPRMFLSVHSIQAPAPHIKSIALSYSLPSSRKLSRNGMHSQYDSQSVQYTHNKPPRSFMT